MRLRQLSAWVLSAIGATASIVGLLEAFGVVQTPIKIPSGELVTFLVPFSILVLCSSTFCIGYQMRPMVETRMRTDTLQRETLEFPGDYIILATRWAKRTMQARFPSHRYEFHNWTSHTAENSSGNIEINGGMRDRSREYSYQVFLSKSGEILEDSVVG